MSPLSRTEGTALAALLAVLSGLGVGVARGAGYLGGLKSAPPLVVSSAPVVTIADTLRSRETVSELFQRRGVSDVDWPSLARAVRNFQPARVRAGLVFLFQQRHGEPAPYAVAARVSRDERLLLQRVADGWSASVERIAWRTEPLVAEGAIENTLTEAVDAAIPDAVLPHEERLALVYGLSEVYDWSLDFSRDVQPGDRFRVVAERMVSVEGEVRYGRVLAARLDVAGRHLYAFRYDDGDRTEFYDESGHSMKREFLRAPLEFKRISSRFSLSRYHPILHVRRAHFGTDFSAAYGAPVRSVGGGTVSFAGREGGYGNLVEIKHNAKMSTRYAHLSGIGPGIHAGARVLQGQTIGYVGASGLATSPHLHYELRINGKAVNPRRQLGSGSGTPIAAARRDGFEREKARLLEVLEPRPAAAIARQG